MNHYKHPQITRAVQHNLFSVDTFHNIWRVVVVLNYNVAR